MEYTKHYVTNTSKEGQNRWQLNKTDCLNTPNTKLQIHVTEIKMDDN